LVRSVVGATQAAPQRSWPVAHGSAQVPDAQMRSAAQALPHIPQFTLSVRGSTQSPEQRRLGDPQTAASVVASGRQRPA
jgi:hypothetical protein